MRYFPGDSFWFQEPQPLVEAVTVLLGTYISNSYSTPK